MDCNICRKDIREHSREEILDCLGSVGITIDDSTNMYSLMDIAGISVTINPRHKHITYNGFGVNYEDLDLEIMRFCLAGPKFKNTVPAWKRKAAKITNTKDTNGEETS